LFCRYRSVERHRKSKLQEAECLSSVTFHVCRETPDRDGQFSRCRCAASVLSVGKFQRVLNTFVLAGPPLLRFIPVRRNSRSAQLPKTHGFMRCQIPCRPSRSICCYFSRERISYLRTAYRFREAERRRAIPSHRALP
jgi:hypothetical protein